MFKVYLKCFKLKSGQPTTDASGFAGAMNKVGSWFMEPENQMFPYVCKANPYHRKEEEYHDFRGDLMPCRKVMFFEINLRYQKYL